MRVAARVIRRGSLPLILVVGFVTTVPGNWLRVQNVDPEFMMVLVQRTIHFGGTFYANAVQVHGPVEPFLYDIAARLGGRNGAWYVVSAMVTFAGIVLGYVAARTARSTGAVREIGVVVGAAVFAHFVISRSDYAGVLYIRNMTTLLLAVAWLLMIEDRVWSSRGRAQFGAVAIGSVLGLTLQSLLSTFAAGVLGLVALGTLWARAEVRDRMPTAALMAGSALATFVSAPIYYAIRGDFTEFWSGWVSYGHVLAIAPGHSTATQFRNGWTVFVRYYTHRPLAWAAILTFVVTLGIIWNSVDRLSRIVHLGLIAWWIAAWVELVFSQRYSAEYFVVTSVPTAMMAAAVVGHVWRGWPARRVPARALLVVPLAGAVCAVSLSGLTSFNNDVRTAWHFRGVNANATAAESNRTGHERTALAVLDLVSRDGDPALIWTNNPWSYLNLKRVAAALFYRSYLLGQVYLGRTSTDYVLPHTWEWFAASFARATPLRTCGTIRPTHPRVSRSRRTLPTTSTSCFPTRRCRFPSATPPPSEVLAAARRKIGRVGRRRCRTPAGRSTGRRRPTGRDWSRAPMMRSRSRSHRASGSTATSSRPPDRSATSSFSSRTTSRSTSG